MTEIYDSYLEQLRRLSRHFADLVGMQGDKVPEHDLKEMEEYVAEIALHVAVLRGMTRGDGF